MDRLTQNKLWRFDVPITEMDVLLTFEREGEWLSRKDIARRLRCAKSPSLIRVVTNMVLHNLLYIRNFPLPNGVDYYKYHITEAGMDAILHGGIPDAFDPAAGG